MVRRALVTPPVTREAARRILTPTTLPPRGPAMPDTPALGRATLAAYLDDALPQAESAAVERALRDSDALRAELDALMRERGADDHSVGQIWREQRLTCRPREELAQCVLGVADPALAEYVTFHIETIGCPFCAANVADLRQQHLKDAEKPKARRARFLASSAGLLPRP